MVVDLERETGISVGGEDLGNGVDVGSSSEVKTEVHVVSSDHNVLGCPLHRVIQTRVHNILLTSTRHSAVEVVVGEDGDTTTNLAKTSFQRVLYGLKEVVVGLSLILEGQTAIGHVVQVLQPLEVGDCHTTSVDVHVGDDQAAVLLQDLVTGGGDGSVGSLTNDLGLNLKQFIVILIHCVLNS